MKGIASVLAAQGRGPDTTLVHMTPGEVHALQGLASLQGGSLTTNPTTGLPEAGTLSRLLPMLAGVAMNYFVPGSGFLGSAGANAAAAGAATGFLQSGNLQGAVTGGLGGLGGGSLVSGLELGAAGGLGGMAPVVDGAFAPVVDGAVASPVSMPSLQAASELTPTQAEALSNVAVDGNRMGEFSRLGAFPNEAAATQLAGGVTPTQAVAGSPTVAATNAPLQAIRDGGYSATNVGSTGLFCPPAPEETNFWNKNDVGSNFWAPGTSGGITGKGGITWLGAGAGLAGVTLMGNRANDLARKNAEERLRRGDPYSKDSMYQQAIAAARAKPWGMATGGITGAYPNRNPENEVIQDPMAQQGTEPRVDPFTGQQQGGMAGGGIAGRPRFLKGAGDGMSDSIPAKIENKQPAALANEEFVIPADIVGALGNGSSEAGAKQLYAMMDRIRLAKNGRKAQPKAIKAEKFLPA